MHPVLVSVLVPVYNSGRYLSECLNSIINQTYTNLHIVLVNDGSTDCSDEVCKQYAGLDKRIEYHNVEHKGISGVRNYLLDLAKGDYSIYIDSDDWVDDDMIEYMVETIRENNLDILTIGHSAETFSKDLEFKQGLVICCREDAVNLFLKGRCLSSSLCLKLIRTTILKKHKFDADIQYGEDVMMTWKLLNNMDSLGVSESRFYHYRNNAESITNSKYHDGTFSLHLVWERIVESCKKDWPDYVEYAERQQDYCHVWLLYTAIRSNYSKDNTIMTIQRNVKKSISRLLLDSGFMTVKAKFFAVCAAYNYSLVKLLISPIRERLSPLR